MLFRSVMYAGKIVEKAAVDDLFACPLHPYTRGLLESVPRIDNAGRRRLYSIPGAPPNLVDLPQGCSFRPRCDKAMEICQREIPREVSMQKDKGSAPRSVCCWLYDPERRGV